MPYLLALLCLVSLILHAETPAGFYRAPALHGDKLVFVSEGDLWRTSAQGGMASRLTTHAGSESLPAISPDGKSLAFSAAIEGRFELYTMPLEGGLPVRRTYDDSQPRAITWTPEGRILYATDRFSTLPDTQLVTLDTKSNERKTLPLAQASAGCYGDDGTLFFVRLPKQGSATKRYRGGWIENLWSYKEGDAEATQLEPKDTSTSRNPMWWSGRLYFVSDRDGMMNLWSMKPNGSDAQQHTRHKDMDVRNPSLDAGRIVYRLGADLRLLDLASAKDSPISIQLTTDFDQRREQWVKKPFEYLTSWHASPNGDRVALTARGEVFVSTFSPGRLVSLPRKEGVRYRAATFMPNGKDLLLQSDASGEIEFWKAPANGSAEPQQITSDGKRFRFTGKPSPDGKWIAWADKDLQLWVRDLEKNVSKLIATNSNDDTFSDFEWSPNSQWLAFVDTAPNTYQQIKLYHLSTALTVTATTDRTNSYNPAWSRDGNWLYFLSDRELKTLVQSPWGQLQPEPFFTDRTKIYMLALRKGAKSPFRPTDELSTTPAPAKSTSSAPSSPTKSRLEDLVKPIVEKLIKDQTKQAEPTKDAPKEAPKPADKPEVKKAEPTKPIDLGIDVEGLITRLEEVPVAAGNYDHLQVGEKHLFYTNKPTSSTSKTWLMRYDISNKKHSPADFAADVTTYELCPKDNKLVLRKGDAFWLTDAAGTVPAALTDSAELSGWSFPITPREEWLQIYRESWRMMRDYFYDRGMHGLDWPAMLKKYEPLVERVTERSDLNEILSDLHGELTTLHIVVRAGDDRDVPDIIETATLGAPLQRDDAAGGWRVQHLWQTDPDYPHKISPLARPGVEIKEGDIITKINSRSTLSVAHPDALLRNLSGKQVLLDVKTGDKSRQVIMAPITNEAHTNIRYDEWEYTRRQKVEALGKGNIGYVHLRAMGEDDMAQWARDFYPQFKRQGLIIDMRHNRGGNIDSWVLEKLMRKAWSYFARPVGEPNWNMQYAFRGHLVVLCDAKTGSDGEGFSEGFRRLGLGKIIGTRTWGGQIWLSAQKWLVDSGSATAAEMGVYGPEGKWLIEGEGVLPDIVVDNLPHQTFLGGDTQLEAGVKHLQALITKDPRPVAPVPPRPKKYFSNDDKK